MFYEKLSAEEWSPPGPTGRAYLVDSNDLARQDPHALFAARLVSGCEDLHGSSQWQKYASGASHIGSHADTEYGDATICGLSIGATREIHFVPSPGTGCIFTAVADRRPRKLTLPSGSMYVIRPPTNVAWYHKVPPSSTVCGPRYVQTFRTPRVGPRFRHGH